MLYLYISIVTATVWALCYKHSLRKGCHPLGMIPCVGASAVILVLVASVFFSQPPFRAEAVALGATAGVSMYFAVLAYFYLIRMGARLGISWTVITLSMTIPTAASILIWHEYPNVQEWTGLLFAVTGITLLARVKPGSRSMNGVEKGLLAIAFLLSGGVALVHKVFVSSALAAHRIDFMLGIYSTVLVLSMFGLFALRRLPGRREIMVGAVMGAAGAGNVIFLVLALYSVTGTVAFPMRTCGNLLLTVFVSAIAWHERLHGKEYAGVVLALLTVVLLTL